MVQFRRSLTKLRVASRKRHPFPESPSQQRCIFADRPADPTASDIAMFLQGTRRLTMSKNMLGVPASEYAGPIGDLRKKLGGKHGKQWFSAFKRFLRLENPWPEMIQATFRGIDALI